MTSISSTITLPHSHLLVAHPLEEIEPLSETLRSIQFTPLSLLCAPMNLAEALYGGFKKRSISDREGITDAALKISSLSLGVIGAYELVRTTDAFHRPLFKTVEHSTLFASSILPLIGGAMGIIELTAEGVFLLRTYRFIKDHPLPVAQSAYIPYFERLSKEYFQLTPEEVTQITTICEESALSEDVKKTERVRMIRAKLAVKKQNLSRRIGSHAVKEIQDHLQSTLQQLKDPSPTEQQTGRKKAAELIAMIRTQSHKKYLIHTLGILAGLLMIAFILTAILYALPVVVFTLFAVASACFLIKYLMEECVLPEKGWKFNALHMIPRWAIKAAEWIRAKTREKNPHSETDSLTTASDQ